MVTSPAVWGGSPKCQCLSVSVSTVAISSWANSVSSEKALVSLQGGVVGGLTNAYLSSRSQAGEKAGDVHSVSLHVAWRICLLPAMGVGCS